MRKLFFMMASMFMFASSGHAVDCSRHTIYCKIVELQPRIDKDRAMELSNLIFKESKKHGIDPMISVAILHQESRFKDENTYKVTRNVKEECHATSCAKTIIEHHEVFDIGIAQINVRTAVGYGFDLERLYDHDIEYAIESHFVILSDKIRQCRHLGDEAWSCYHSATPEFRKKYIKMVSKFL